MQNQGNVMLSNSNINPAVPFPGGVVYLQPTPAPARVQYDSYYQKQSVGLGATQIVLGCLCIVFNAVALGIGMYYYDMSFVGHGFWCGVLFIITGALGMSAGMNKTRCKIVSYMVLCIISACFTVALLTCGILGSVLSGAESNDECRYYGYGYGYNYYYRSPCNSLQVVAVMEGCMAVCGFIAAVLFIWGSTLACKAKVCNCCTGTYPPQAVIAYTHCSPENFPGGLNPVSYPIATMPYQQGMVAMAGLPPYTANQVQPYMVPGMPTAMGEGQNEKQ